MIQDKNWVELNLNLKFKNGKGSKLSLLFGTHMEIGSWNMVSEIYGEQQTEFFVILEYFLPF